MKWFWWHNVEKLQIKEVKVGHTFLFNKTLYMKTDHDFENCTECVDLTTDRCSLLNKELYVQLKVAEIIY